MKKHYLSFLVTMAITIGAGMSYCLSSGGESLSELQLENLEALAGDDEESELKVNCFCKTNWFSPNVCSANASGAYCGGNPCANHDSNCR